MIKKPRGIQGNIDRFGSANMYLSGALDCLCISPEEALSDVEARALSLGECLSKEAYDRLQEKFWQQKIDIFKRLCEENFWTVRQVDGAISDPLRISYQIGDPFLVITHDHLRGRSPVS